MYTTIAKAKIEGLKGYKFGQEVKVFLQENKYDARIAIFTMANVNGDPGYHLYDNLEEMKLDFDLGDFSLYETR